MPPAIFRGTRGKLGAYRSSTWIKTEIEVWQFPDRVKVKKKRDCLRARLIVLSV